MIGVILHGGRAKGLSSLAYSEVRQPLQVAGTPTGEYALRDPIEACLTDMGIVVEKNLTKISGRLIGTGSDVVKGSGIRKSTRFLAGRNTKVEPR